MVSSSPISIKEFAGAYLSKIFLSEVSFRRWKQRMFMPVKRAPDLSPRLLNLNNTFSLTLEKSTFLAASATSPAHGMETSIGTS